MGAVTAGKPSQNEPKAAGPPPGRGSPRGDNRCVFDAAGLQSRAGGGGQQRGAPAACSLLGAAAPPGHPPAGTSCRQPPPPNNPAPAPAHTGCLLVAAASAAAAACPELCPAAAAPVCGEDGLPYASPCVAACAGARVAHRGYCAGGPGALKFVVPDSRRGARKERQAVITREVMQQYSGAGFSYLGRVNLADAPSGPAFSGGNATQLGGSSGGRRFANEAGPAHAHGGRRSGAVAGASSSGELGGGSASSGGGSSGHLHALRYTPAGDVYYARLNASAAAALSRIPPTPPAAAAAGGGSSAAPAAAGAELLSAAAGASSRALRSIIGSDDRESCGQPPAYPMTAVGELEFVVSRRLNIPYTYLHYDRGWLRNNPFRCT